MSTDPLDAIADPLNPPGVEPYFRALMIAAGKARDLIAMHDAANRGKPCKCFYCQEAEFAVDTLDRIAQCVETCYHPDQIRQPAEAWLEKHWPEPPATDRHAAFKRYAEAMATQLRRPDVRRFTHPDDIPTAARPPPGIARRSTGVLTAARLFMARIPPIVDNLAARHGGIAAGLAARSAMPRGGSFLGKGPTMTQKTTEMATASDGGHIAPHAPLTFQQLAAAVGRSFWSIRRYALAGTHGVHLAWEWDVNRRVTSLKRWNEFRERVARARSAEAIQRWKAADMAADAGSDRKRGAAARRAAIARKKLEQMGAR